LVDSESRIDFAALSNPVVTYKLYYFVDQITPIVEFDAFI